MTLLERLRAKYTEYDRRVIASLGRGYDARAAEMRDLLRDALTFVEHREQTK